MKRSISLAIVISLSIATISAEQIKVPGFGAITVQKTAEGYSVPLGKLGTFVFTGDISPSAFHLQSKVPLSRLQNFPGFRMLELLKPSDISLDLSTAGLEMKGRVDSSGKLATLLDFLRVSNLSLDLSATITTSSIDLTGSLMFGQKGISIPIIPPLGTVFTFSGLTLHANVGGGIKEGVSGAALDLTGDFRMQPSKWDPALKLKASFSYNLMNQELGASGSMVDTWENPLGLKRILKGKQTVSISNAAVEIGWIPGTPSPTKVGVIAQRIQFFNFAGGFALDLSPADGKAAFMVALPNITLNELQNFMLSAFEKKLPSLFSKSFGLKNAKILFSPNGGKVGEFVIQQGFELKGEASFGSNVSGFLDCYADFERGIQLAGGFKQNLDKLILKKLEKRPALKTIMGKILSTFTIRKAEILMKASTAEFAGAMELDCTVLGRKISFKVKASFDPEEVAEFCADKIFDEIKDLAVDAYKEAEEAAELAYGETKKFVVGAAGEVWDSMKSFSTKVKHSVHTFNKCYNDCVPDYANHGGGKMYEKAEQAINKYAASLRPKLQKIEGSDANDTRTKRKQAAKSGYDRVVAEIDAQFQKLKDDQEVRKFFSKSDSKNKGERKYEDMIQSHWVKYRNYANQQWTVMTS